MRPQNGPPTDVKQLLARQMYATPIPACNDHFEKNRPCPQGPFGATDQYVVLDSFNKLDSSIPEQGIYRWNFNVQGPSTPDGDIGVRNAISNVIEMHIGEFCMPAVQPVPYDTSPPFLSQNTNVIPITQLPFCDTVTIEVTEIGLQSISDCNGKRHHFELRLEQIPNEGSRYLAVPKKRFEIYIFTIPIMDLRTVTLVFKNPDININIPRDVFENVMARVDVGQQIQFLVPGNTLNIGDRVFISGFSSTDTTINNYINRCEGHVVGVNGFISGDVFRLNPDVSSASLGLAVGDTIPNKSCLVIKIAKNRIRIPLRFRCVLDKVTQYHTIGSFP